MTTMTEENDKLENILFTIGQLTHDESLEVKTRMKEKFSLTFPEPLQVETPAVVVEEATHFQVVIKQITKKIEVLKVLREIKNYSLLEAKAAVDELPHAVKDGPFEKAKAQEFQAKLVATGAVVDLV